jgi:hypothetical protein
MHRPGARHRRLSQNLTTPFSLRGTPHKPPPPLRAPTAARSRGRGGALRVARAPRRRARVEGERAKQGVNSCHIGAREAISSALCSWKSLDSEDANETFRLCVLPSPSKKKPSPFCFWKRESPRLWPATAADIRLFTFLFFSTRRQRPTAAEA